MNFRVGDRVRIEGVVKSVDQNNFLSIRSDRPQNSHGLYFAHASRCQLIDSPLRPGDRVTDSSSRKFTYTVRSEPCKGFIFAEPDDNTLHDHPTAFAVDQLERIND